MTDRYPHDKKIALATFGALSFMVLMHLASTAAPAGTVKKHTADLLARIFHHSSQTSKKCGHTPIAKLHRSYKDFFKGAGITEPKHFSLRRDLLTFSINRTDLIYQPFGRIFHLPGEISGLAPRSTISVQTMLEDMGTAYARQTHYTGMSTAEHRAHKSFLVFLTAPEAAEFKKLLTENFPTDEAYRRAIVAFKYLLSEIYDEPASYPLLGTDNRFRKHDIFSLRTDGSIDFIATVRNTATQRNLIQVLQRTQTPDLPLLRAMKLTRGLSLTLPGSLGIINPAQTLYRHWPELVRQNPSLSQAGSSTAETIDRIETLALAGARYAIFEKLGAHTARNLGLSNAATDKNKLLSASTRRIFAGLDPALAVAAEKHVLPRLRGNAVTSGLLPFNETYFELWSRAEAGGATDYPLPPVIARRVGAYGIWQMPEGRVKQDRGELHEKLKMLNARPVQEPYGIYDGKENKNINFNAFYEHQGPLVRLMELDLNGITIAIHINKGPFWPKHGLILVEPEQNHNQALRPVALRAVQAMFDHLHLDKRFRIGINTSRRWGGDVNHMHLHLFLLPEAFTTSPLESAGKTLLRKESGVELSQVNNFILDAVSFKGRGPAFEAAVMDHIRRIMAYGNDDPAVTIKGIDHGVVWGADGTLYIVHGQPAFPEKIAPIGMGIDGKLGIPYVIGEKIYQSITAQDIAAGLSAYRSLRYQAQTAASPRTTGIAPTVPALKPALSAAHSI